MPEYVCVDCYHRFLLEPAVGDFEANPIIQCPHCHGNNVEDTVANFIRGLNIKECNECEQIQQLQETRHINVAPLFWQGRGRPEIPLVIMGINPSVVGTNNEPQRGCDFDSYFGYYQNRAASEAENTRLAREGGFIRRIPRSYWTRCHKLASYCIGGGTPRWENYVLMEAIHCFFNSIRDLEPNEINAVAARCFERHTKKMLMELKPRKMILLGNEPYEVFRQYVNLEREINKYEYCALNVNGLRIPVLRHPHPTGFNDGPFYRPDIYDDFNRYCDDFDYGEQQE